MPNSAPDSTQLGYARLAGFLYLFNYVLVIVGQVLPSMIRGSGDFVVWAPRIAASEHLYRAGLVSTMIGWISVVVLAFVLYVTLEPVNRRAAPLPCC